MRKVYRKNEHRTLKGRTSNIERPTSNVEWKKMKKQKYDLEDRLLEYSVFSLFFVGRPVLFERSGSKKGVIL